MLIEARDVTKAFGAFKAVDKASVTVEEGDILGLIGPNGAGKSTFFNCLTGDLPPTSGSVHFAGTDVTREPPEARARLGLARSFQVPLTFESMTVLDNVMIGALLRHPHARDARAKARDVLERVGLGLFAEAPARSLVSIDDVGEATAWLATDAARRMTGQTLYIDGGYHIID